MDKEALRQDLLRAEQARQLTENEFLNEILEGVKRKTFEAWLDAPTDEDANQIRKVAIAARQFEQTLRSAIKGGDVASAEIARSEDS